MDEMTVYKKLISDISTIFQCISEKIEDIEYYPEEIRECAKTLSEETGIDMLEACSVVQRITCEEPSCFNDSQNGFVNESLSVIADFFSGLYDPVKPRKYPRTKNERIQHLFLDRRQKHHRCRNNC